MSRFHEHLSSEGGDQHPERPNQTDIATQIREATSAPSPLTRYLQDPAVMDALESPGSRSKKHSHSSSSSTRTKTSILGVVLAEEEKQAHKLKTLLRITGDRLDREIRRAIQAGCRAEHAESRVLELTGRVSQAESSKYVAELEAARAKEEIRRYQMQIESLERDVKRLRADVGLLEGQKREAEESASRARETARSFEMNLRNIEARQIGREEGMRYGLHKWFKTGRIEGWDAGNAEGYECGRGDGYERGRTIGLAEGEETGMRQGRKIGRQEGFEQGFEEGRREEREHALQAFDDFLAAEVDDRDQVTRKQAERWSSWMRRRREIK